jgi:hypothetical protein
MGGIVLPHDASRVLPLQALNNKAIIKKYQKDNSMYNGMHHAQHASHMLPLQALKDKERIKNK